MSVARAEAWMRDRAWTPFNFQRETWNAYLERKSGLVHAPTGLGKTLAVWLGPVAEALEHDDASRGIRVLWITPLRALATDTAESLRKPLGELGLDWTVELRTGDTSSSIKARQRKMLPHALVTTPESLTVLLSYPEARARFKGLRCVVVDEWHELLGTKRGTQTELALARLRRFAPDLRTWGLSATLGNLDVARDHLLGDRSDAGVMIEGPPEREVELEILLPDNVERFPWAGHMGLSLLPKVYEAIQRANTTLIFTNTRSQCEIWFRTLLQKHPDLLGDLAIHHGSLDRDLRREVETMIRDGALKAVVCTSSLDLGVDFPAVDQVMQVGSPKGVARLLQRAGRSGHRPGAVSRVVCVASHAFELMEFSAARAALATRRVEPRDPPAMPLDVLVQHAVTAAAGGGFAAAALVKEARTTAAYRDLTDEQWGWVLDFVRTGGPALTAYPRYARVRFDESKDDYVPSTPQITREHRLGIGTISSDASMKLAYASGKRLGVIEESFINHLKPGDRFAFSGRLLEYVKSHEMTAYVKRASGGKGSVPRWNGSRFPLSTRLADHVVARFEAFERGEEMDDAAEAMRPLLELQQRVSRLPSRDELLIESTQLRDGQHVFLYFFAGRLVHEGVGALLAHRLTQQTPRTVLHNCNDYGVELLCPDPLPLDEVSWRMLLSPERLIEDLLMCVNESAMARRQFREIARIAGLLVPTYPGRSRTTRHLQASTEMFFDVLSEFDAENLLLAQARREVLSQQLEFARQESALQRAGTLPIRIVETKRLTPLAFPLFADRLRAEHVSTEKWQERVRRDAERLEKAWEKDRVKGGGARV